MERRTLVTVALLLMASSGVAAAADSLDRRLSRIAGSSVDCGSTGESLPNRTTVNACVREHFLKNQSFRARFAGRCEDSICATGIVLESPAGGLYIVHFDSEGCKPSMQADAFCGTTLEQCMKPVLVPQGDGLKLVCKNEYAL